MCCGSFWALLQLLWSLTYVLCGSVQLLAGIFFIISIPALQLTSTIVAGSVNVIIGIAGGVLVCFAQLSPRRQEFLVYMAVSVLAVNVVNVVFTEWGLYFTDIDKLIEDHPHHVLIHCACFVIRITAAVCIVISFLDSQFAYCSKQIRASKEQEALKKKKLVDGDLHEQVADIEYIIPREKNKSKSHTVIDAYAQSWVFETDQATCSNNISPAAAKNKTAVLQNGTPKTYAKVNDLQNSAVTDSTQQQHHQEQQQQHLIDNPVVQIEEASDDSTSNSDRKLGHMKSFSRSASPAQLSASSSQISLNFNANNPEIYQCLEKLTEPQIYRSRLNTALSNKSDDDYQAPQAVMMRRIESAASPRSEKVQYASLMKELTKAIGSKKDPNITSPQNSESPTSDKTQTNSKTSSRQSQSEKSSDTEFSKELEAALQLIQDLESPNTIETPSDPKSNDTKDRPLALWRNSDPSASEKTLSALGSLGDVTTPMECAPELHTFKPNGKGASIIVHHYPDSQSTSGYSSPTHPISNGNTPIWSTTSSINGSNTDIIKPISYSIHNAKSTTVISLYTQNPNNSKPKSVTLVSISGDNQPLSTPPSPIHSSTVLLDNHQQNGDVTHNGNSHHMGTTQFGVFDNKVSPNGTTNPNGWKSLLRKKKHIHPKLCPELEGAIVKSESLAYLSELELLARHERNKEIHREIEERVIQQLGVPRTESKC